MDDDADSAGTPPPPEQRPWRHPSEMSEQLAPWAVQVEAMRTTRRRETVLAAGAGLFGAVAAGALLVLLLPGGADGPTLVAPAANSSAPSFGNATATTVERNATPPATTAPVLEPDATTTTTTATITTTVAIPTTTVARPSTLASVVDDTAMSTPWPTLAHNGAVAVPLAESGLFLTTAAGAEGASGTYTVRWSDSDERLATVVATGDGYAVLQLDRRLDDVEGVRVAGAAPAPGSWVTIWSTDRHRAVVVKRDEGLALAGVVAEGALEGAPVLDERGELVGLCTHRRGATTLVPVVGLDTVIDSRREAAWLGVAVTSSEVDGLAVVTVTEVTDDSPAAQAGLTVDDVIVAFGGEPIDSVVRLADRVGTRRPGDVITLDVRRGDTVWSVEVILTSRPFSL